MGTLRKHAMDMQASAETAMDVESAATNADRAAYEARLDRTVKSLRDRVKEQETALEKVHHYNDLHYVY